jgi:hypothetical protein
MVKCCHGGVIISCSTKKSQPLSWNYITAKIRNSALPHNSHPVIRPTLLQWESGPIWEVAFLWETNSVQHYYLSPYEIFSDELWGLWWGCHHQRVTTYNNTSHIGPLSHCRRVGLIRGWLLCGKAEFLIFAVILFYDNGLLFFLVIVVFYRAFIYDFWLPIWYLQIFLSLV